ncbi:hypothetical protein FRC12_021217 [Ceratobasidium sp. 428]|nr:hypothetical protein FRC12_021217 [Ceratobasidium sp. 428]
MYLSQGNACLAVFGATGYKQRAPYLEYYLLEGSDASQDFPESYSVEPGFAEVAVHAALDESRRLIFLGDSRRVKSFAWAAPNGEAYEEPHPTHTLASNRVHGPLAVLLNGTVLRAGKGEVAVWNIDSLNTHGESGEQIIGKEDESIRENTWRDDPEEIEASSGSSPDSYIRFAGHPDWEIGRWKPLIQTPSTMLCQINRYACGTIDMERGGSIAARYLGHGGTLTDFAFSGGDPQVFATACSDGFARLFDIRTPLPVLTFDACQNIDSCDAVALAHPDGIPTLFSGTCKAHQIKVWDIRARTPVYELATGNNQVQALAWDPTRNHLYAATECGYLDRMGNHHEYRYVRKEAGRAPGNDSDDEDDEYLEGEQAWPENAWHTENYFSYMFDAGDHRIYRYAFKEDPDISILPGYGDATPGGFDSYW